MRNIRRIGSIIKRFLSSSRAFLGRVRDKRNAAQKKYWRAGGGVHGQYLPRQKNSLGHCQELNPRLLRLQSSLLEPSSGSAVVSHSFTRHLAASPDNVNLEGSASNSTAPIGLPAELL